MPGEVEIPEEVVEALAAERAGAKWQPHRWPGLANRYRSGARSDLEQCSQFLAPSLRAQGAEEAKEDAAQAAEERQAEETQKTLLRNQVQMAAQLCKGLVEQVG